MKEYQIRNGIFLEEICGRYILISTEAIQDKCSYIRKIDDIVAYYWEMMEQGLSIDDMVLKASEAFEGIDQKTLRNDISELIAQMKKAGYLLSDEEMECELR